MSEQEYIHHAWQEFARWAASGAGTFFASGNRIASRDGYFRWEVARVHTWQNGQQVRAVWWFAGPDRHGTGLAWWSAHSEGLPTPRWWPCRAARLTPAYARRLGLGTPTGPAWPGWPLPTPDPIVLRADLRRLRANIGG